ncbi:unnamed protein product [marine sediment metagenome]|uniref:Uncharacterized protein n=1 Tax=marine sediment metagenome TaxID=412755 RepID=X1J2W2_9ZZZZ
MSWPKTVQGISTMTVADGAKIRPDPESGLVRLSVWTGHVEGRARFCPDAAIELAKELIRAAQVARKGKTP